MWKLLIDKVHIFWEGHKILWNLHQLFALWTASQIIGGDFAKFFGLLRIYELYIRNFERQFHQSDFLKFFLFIVLQEPSS